MASQTLNKYSLITVDIAAIILAGFVANTIHWLYLNAPADEFLRIWVDDPRAELRLTLFIALVAVSIGWFWLLGHYTRRRPFWDEIAEVIRVLSVLAVVDAALMYLAKLQFSRFWFLGIWFLALALIPIARILLKRILTKLGVWQRPAIVLGTGENALDAVEALHSEPAMGFEVIAFIRPRESGSEYPTHIDNRGLRYPVLAFADNPLETLRNFGRPTVIVALEQEDLLREVNQITNLHRYCNDIRVVLPVRGLPLFGATVHHFLRHELFFLMLRNNLARSGPRFIKRLVDLVVSAMLLILLSPFFAYFVWTIRRDGGPAFFLHERVGRNSLMFRCLKFRTMVTDAKGALQRLLDSDPAARSEWERDFKLKNDPRITSVGKFLREYSLDELPQLWNVFMGDMSLVGPRPIVKEELKRYAEYVDFYLETRPGMTGLWQISGRNNTDYDYRVYLDSWYVKNWSLWYDFVILFKTMRVVLAKEGAF